MFRVRIHKQDCAASVSLVTRLLNSPSRNPTDKVTPDKE